jgi:hypothetical protein
MAEIICLKACSSIACLLMDVSVELVVSELGLIVRTLEKIHNEVKSLRLASVNAAVIHFKSALICLENNKQLMDESCKSYFDKTITESTHALGNPALSIAHRLLMTIIKSTSQIQIDQKHARTLVKFNLLEFLSTDNVQKLYYRAAFDGYDKDSIKLELLKSIMLLFHKMNAKCVFTDKDKEEFVIQLQRSKVYDKISITDDDYCVVSTSPFSPRLIIRSTEKKVATYIGHGIKNLGTPVAVAGSISMFALFLAVLPLSFIATCYDVIKYDLSFKDEMVRLCKVIVYIPTELTRKYIMSGVDDKIGADNLLKLDDSAGNQVIL